MLILGSNFKPHRTYAAIAVLLGVAACAWYGWASFTEGRLLGGGSATGIVYGLLGGSICVFECLLYARKNWFRGWRLGRVQTWMILHIWLGLLSVPILLLHAGPRWGGPLAMWTMIVFLVVIASGVWGLFMQNWLPSKMLAEVQAETIYSQIGLIIDQFRDEAATLVMATCGRDPSRATPEEDDDTPESTQHFVVGRQRTAGKISGKALQTQTAIPLVPKSEPLRQFFYEAVEPFLMEDGFHASRLRRADHAASLFEGLRTRLDPKAFPAVNMIEDLCNQRRQLAKQARLHYWLHNWLLVHAPLSAALLVLMFVHAIVAWRYK